MLDEDNAVVKEHFSLALHPVMLDVRVESKTADLIFYPHAPQCKVEQRGIEPLTS